MAAKPRQQKRRNVLEHFTDLSPSPSSSSSAGPTSIRSLAVSTLSDSETLIYVGTVSGNLLLYSLNLDPVNKSTDAVSFLRYISVTDSPVESILVFNEIEKVLVVSDGFMHFIDLLLLRPVKKINTLRGVSIVARRFRSSDSESSNLTVGDNSAEVSNVGLGFLQKLGGGGGVRSNGSIKKSKERADTDLPIDDNCVFAVAVGKRLVLVGLVGRGDGSFDGVSGSLVTMRDVQCPHIVNALVWVDDSVIVGTSSGYLLCSCVTGQWNLIFSLPDTSSPPRLKLLMKEYKVLMLVDNVGIIVDSLGHPVGGSLVFRSDPDAIGEMRTFVVAVESGSMELYLKKSGYCVQTVSIAGGATGKCVVADDEDGSGKLVAVATHSKVFQLSEGMIHVEGGSDLAHWCYLFQRFFFCL